MEKSLEALPDRLFGVTVDKVESLVAIVDAIKGLKGGKTVKPIVRVVFDFDETIFNAHKNRFREEDFAPEVQKYKEAIEAINHEAYVMGEIVDSSAIYRCHFDPDLSHSYVERTKAYIKGLRGLVKIWEVGNEINGEWAGWNNDHGDQPWEKDDVTVADLTAMRRRVATEIRASFDTIKSLDQEAVTALTFLYNDDGTNHGWPNSVKYVDGQPVYWGHNYSMLEWAREQQRFLPDVDYVLLSYYEDDNEGVQPNRHSMSITGLVGVLKELATHFDNKTQYGFGEFAPQCHYGECEWTRTCRKCRTDQKEFIPRYYAPLEDKIRNALADDPGWNKDRNWMGGYFYWYFKQDGVNHPTTETSAAFKNAFAHWFPSPR